MVGYYFDRELHQSFEQLQQICGKKLYDQYDKVYSTLDTLSYTFARESSLQDLTTTMSNEHTTFSFETTTFSILTAKEKQRTDEIFKMAYEKCIQGDKSNKLLEDKIERIRGYMKQSFTCANSVMTTIHHVDSGDSIMVPVKVDEIWSNLNELMTCLSQSECILKMDIRSSKKENWTVYTLSVVNVLSNRVVVSKTYPKQEMTIFNPVIYKHKPIEELIDCVFGGGFAKGMYGLMRQYHTIHNWNNPECMNCVKGLTYRIGEYDQGLIHIYAYEFPTESNDKYLVECLRQVKLEMSELYHPSTEWNKQQKKECETNNLNYKKVEQEWKLYEMSEKVFDKLVKI